MAKQRVYGLASIVIGDIAGDGGIGLTLTEIFGDTVPGSAVLENTEGTYEPVNIEEDSAPIDNITTQEGTWTLRFSTYNASADALIAIFGGTKTGVAPNEIWSAPDNEPIVEKSVIATTKGGVEFQVARMKLVGNASFAFDKTRYGQVNVIGTILKPTKAGEAKLKIGNPA